MKGKGMKINQNLDVQSSTQNFKTACLSFCQRMLQQIENVRNSIIAEYSALVGGQEHLLRLTLNEAEALAWETDFPQLVFPALATEKVAALAEWQRRQRTLKWDGEELALAA
jgi:hypothetical protein